MTGARGIMIDRDGTPDRDDAIWAEPSGDGGWDLAVHIACAADAARPGSPADERAAQMAQSIYLPDKTIHMLPGPAGKAASLSPGRNCPVVTVNWHVSPDGTASGARVSEGRLRDPAAMDYAAATAAVTDRASAWHQPMAAAHQAATAMLGRRRRDGALAIYDLVRGMASDGDGGLRQLAPVERHAAYMIVAEFMVAANTLLAGYCAAQDIPVLFRAHQPAAAAPGREQLMDDLRTAVSDGEEWRRDAARQRLGHLLRPAVYSVHAAEHFGLRLPFYCHATSPLRRYADLVFQRQLLAALRGQEPPHAAADLAAIAEAVNSVLRERRERRAERHKEQTKEQRRGELAAGAYEALDADQFYRLLKLAAAEQLHAPGLEAELLRRINAGALLARDAYPVLTAPGQEWDTARAAVTGWLARHPEHAVTLTAIHARNLGMDAPLWEEHHAGTVQKPRFSARAGIEADGTVTWSAVRVARRKDSARQQAALSFLAVLAGQPDPSATDACPAIAGAGPGPDTAGRSPVTALNELDQAGTLRGLSWDFAMTGPPHAPEFTCTATAVRAADGQPLAASGTAGAKKDAKTAAARRLHEIITSEEHDHE